MLADYGYTLDVLHILCDNVSAINIDKNPVQFSRTKQIDIKYHYLRQLVEDGILKLEYVDIEHQLADIFTKALDAVMFEKLKASLGLCVL